MSVEKRRNLSSPVEHAVGIRKPGNGKEAIS